MQALRRVQIDPYLRAPATDESDFIEEGGLDDLSQGLNHILHINVANQQPQPEATLQLLDPVMHILWLQQNDICSDPGLKLLLCVPFHLAFHASWKYIARHAQPTTGMPPCQQC